MDIQPQHMTTSKLLANRLFRIPKYQRAYSWKKKQRADMFEDIWALRDKPEDNHFMATVVGLRREIKTIVTDQYRVVEVVDGQQRITTLVILLKAVEKKLDRTLTAEDKLGRELKELLVKQDNVSLLLLQTNHDKSHYFVNYLRDGECTPTNVAKTLADRELLSAIEDCEEFVDKWENRIDLLRIIKNQLNFIFYEIDNEATVYTVFEVLNNRGLRVSWLDRLKSMLMAIAFEHGKGNREEHISELHNIWGTIYETIGLQQGMSTEALRFAATLRSGVRSSKLYGEEDAVEYLVGLCDKSAAKAIDVSQWLLKVTVAVDRFLVDADRSRSIAGIAQARLLAVAILLSPHTLQEKDGLLRVWEIVSFRVFGLCRKDARTGVGEYVRLSWDILNSPAYNPEVVIRTLRAFSEGAERGIDWAEEQLRDENCYEGWEEELRYLLYRYEEYLAMKMGQSFSNEQWNRIWEASAAKSIEHVFPQSKGQIQQVAPGKQGIFVHRLGNLMLLPPDLNSQLADKDPSEKVDAYRRTGLLSATEVAETISKKGWSAQQVIEREASIIAWARETWA